MTNRIANTAAHCVLTRTVARVNTRSFLEGLGGLVVSLTYTKLDGSVRVLTGRLGVKAPLKGGANTVESHCAPYIVFFDFVKRAYRTVNLNTLMEIRALSRRYAVQ